MLNNLGAMLDYLHKVDEASATMERSLAILEKLPRPHVFEIGVLRSNLSEVDVERGRLDWAERDARQATETLAQLPNPPVNLGYSRVKLALIERWTGRADAALADLERGAAETIRVAGADHPYALTARVERDYQRAVAGHAAEAEADLVECLEAIRRTKGGINDQRALAALGYVRTIAGRPQEGEAPLRASLASAQRKGFSMTTALTQIELAECLARQGKKGEAQNLLTSAHSALEKLFGPEAWLARSSARLSPGQAPTCKLNKNRQN
jgi:tetratricopeptide (TPR) repeat protein